MNGGSRRQQRCSYSELTNPFRNCIMTTLMELASAGGRNCLKVSGSGDEPGQGPAMSEARRPLASKSENAPRSEPQPPIGPPAQERATFLVNRVNAKLAQVANRLFRIHGIDVVSSRILIYLLERGQMRVGELVDLLALPQSTISHQLRRLDKAKLIRRRRSLEDNRAVAVVLTSAGRFAAQECNAFSLAVHRRMASHLGEREIRQLNLLLLQMFEVLNDVEAPPARD
jgi:DNA-binding MarR family transcriptional regulator